jgi:hypothetical protein
VCAEVVRPFGSNQESPASDHLATVQGPGPVVFEKEALFVNPELATVEADAF